MVTKYPWSWDLPQNKRTVLTPPIAPNPTHRLNKNGTFSELAKDISSADSPITRDTLGEELAKIEQQISNWCMRMAWPGKAPTPPFSAWERRSEIYESLRVFGVINPKNEHHAWRKRIAAK